MNLPRLDSSAALPRAYRIVGVPFAGGALGQGAREAPAALRRAGLLTRIHAAGLDCDDLGDVELPAGTDPRLHSIAPIRHWPLPRLVWEATRDRLRPILADGHIPLVLGGDCSIFVGVAQAAADSAHGASDGSLRVIYVDGHIDAEMPRAEKCVGAAAMGLRIATEATPFWPGPIVPPSSVTALGCSRQIHEQIPHFTLDEVRRIGPQQAARLALGRCADSDRLLVHFDVDVVADAELPGAYDASADGLTLAEARALLGTLLADGRVCAIEVTEYCPGNDPDQRGAHALADLLASALTAEHAAISSADATP